MDDDILTKELEAVFDGQMYKLLHVFQAGHSTDLTNNSKLFYLKMNLSIRLLFFFYFYFVIN